MKLHHFFIQEPHNARLGAGAIGRDLSLPDADLAHQLKTVFRFRQGDQVVLLDNSGYQYLASIVALKHDEVVFHIHEQRKDDNTPEHLPARVTLFFSLIKKDNVEWIIQKGTELGVASFVPVLSERSEKKNLNYDRLRKIIKEASEQSERGVMPTLCEIVSLAEAFEKSVMPADMTCVIFDRGGKPYKMGDSPVGHIGETDEKKSVGIFIGPEGGWSENELAFFKSRKAEIYSLGPQVLRAETAAISAAALFLLG